MQGCLDRHLSQRINRDLTAFRASLTVAVQHFERDLFNVQRRQCPAAIPCRDSWHLILGPVGLRQHEPIPTEYKPLERHFGFDVITIGAGFFNSPLDRDGHA